MMEDNLCLLHIIYLVLPYYLPHTAYAVTDNIKEIDYDVHDLITYNYCTNRHNMFSIKRLFFN